MTKAQSTIQVLSAVANITVGETENLNASSEVSVQYTSSNPDVITVDSKGNMTAKHAGTATIQLTGNENTYYFAPAAVNVQVTVPEPETVAQKALTMYNGAKTPQAFLEVCHNVASTIVSDGNWIYSKNNNKNTFVDSRNAARRNTDCAHYVSMCMQQFGTLPQGYRFHSDKATNQISYHPNNAKGKQVIEQAFAKYYNVLKYNGVPANQLDLKPGDICCYSGHVNVYAGKNSAGKSMWYDFAPGGTSDGKEESGYFTRVVKTGEMRMKVYTVLRLK